jgi:hypothetical protein
MIATFKNHFASLGAVSAVLLLLSAALPGGAYFSQ